MPDLELPTSGGWRRATDAAERLREAFAVLGVPDHEARKPRAQTDLSGNGYVYLGVVSIDTAERLLAALAEHETTP